MDPIKSTEEWIFYALFLFRDASIKAKNWTALAVKRGGEVRLSIWLLVKNAIPEHCYEYLK